MTVSITDICVVRMVPVIILMAWCCIVDSLLEFDFAVVGLAAIPYSGMGWIISTQSFFFFF